MDRSEGFEPWYNHIDTPHPFSSVVALSSPDNDCNTSFRAVACFPWTLISFEDLWNGEFNNSEKLELWRKTIQKWAGVVAVGGGRKVRFILTRRSQPCISLFTILIPDPKANVTSVAWCMVANADEFWPLVAFAGNGILYVFNLERGVYHGVMRGHGGSITSLAVHPTDPCLLCSTSHDHTVRIYDLTLTVACPITNPSWPGRDKPCLGGPAFGLRANEGEGDGHGRCIAVLAGGPSGGHQAAVLGAAFHPTFPLIATCGMDNAVKLWRIPPLDGKILRREDKPLFSSSRIHSAQVLSISWLGQDILLSHSGPIVKRHANTKQLCRVPGTMVLWRWLGLDRFFPPDKQSWPAVIRGCASDYQESSSFKIISVSQLPLPTEPVRIHVYQSMYHAPIVLIPSQGGVKAICCAHFTPREPPTLPGSDEELSNLAKGMQIEETTGGSELPCWEIEARKSQDNQTQRLEACTMAEDGTLLVGVGAREGIWIWRNGASIIN